MPVTPRTVLISIHPRFVDLILKGDKRVEFRRSWAKEPVDRLVIYATAPVMRVVAVVPVLEVLCLSVSGLWEIAKEHGGGLTREELRQYFKGKDKGFGIRLGHVTKLQGPLQHSRTFPAFRPPQSFRYLTSAECKTMVCTS